MRKRLLFFLCLVAGACSSACSDSGTGAPGADSDAARPGLPRLHAEGKRIVDAEGNAVVLRGVNLGCWLFHENWISQVDYPLHGRIYVLGHEQGIGTEVETVLRRMGPARGARWIEAFEAGLEELVGGPATDAFLSEVARYPVVYDDSDRATRTLLEERFGTEGRDRLLDAFWGAWIREPDIEWIAAQGFNVVRVPIGYRNLIVQSEKEPLRSLDWNERAFARLDSLLRWCEKYGVYAVIDIQEAPGGQNDYSGPARLYEDPLMQELTLELWEELSRRYYDRDVVAAYSLLAEPFGAPSAQARDDMYDRIVTRIRGRGDDHLLVIHDGFFGMATLPRPEERGWENVVYSTHIFEFDVTNLLGYQILVPLYDRLFNRSQEIQRVPYYIGSFSTMKDEEFAYRGASLLVDLYERSGWSWSLWTYKKIDDPIDQELFGITTSWGLRGRLASSFERPDLYRDGEADLMRAFAGYADLVLDPNERLLDILLQGGRVAQGY